MEQSIFPRPEVSAALQNVVAARSHTDATDSPFHSQIIELQERYTGTIALPIYVIIDPKTGDILAKKAGIGGGPERMIEFLRKGTAD